MKYLSKTDFDKTLKENSFIDETIIIDLQGMPPEFIMTKLNQKNNWRLCQARKIEGGKCSFVKRTYFENAEIDKVKYSEYFQKVLFPLLMGSNELLIQEFPELEYLTK